MRRSASRRSAPSSRAPRSDARRRSARRHWTPTRSARLWSRGRSSPWPPGSSVLAGRSPRARRAGTRDAVCRIAGVTVSVWRTRRVETEDSPWWGGLTPGVRRRSLARAQQLARPARAPRRCRARVSRPVTIAPGPEPGGPTPRPAPGRARARGPRRGTRAARASAAPPRRPRTSARPRRASRQSRPANAAVTRWPAPRQSNTVHPAKPRPRRSAWMPQRKSACRCAHGVPAGLSTAKSADRANAGATQHSPTQREQSARSSTTSRHASPPCPAPASPCLPQPRRGDGRPAVALRAVSRAVWLPAAVGALVGVLVFAPRPRRADRRLLHHPRLRAHLRRARRVGHAAAAAGQRGDVPVERPAARRRDRPDRAAGARRGRAAGGRARGDRRGARRRSAPSWSGAAGRRSSGSRWSRSTRCSSR